MMRARIRGASDLAQTAEAALSKNTEAMADLLEPVIGGAARGQFAHAWGEHIEALFNYSRGLATKDESVRTQAHEELVEYETDLAQFFAGASHGRLTPEAALSGIRTHVDHLVDNADAYAARDYTQAAMLYRMSYAHSYELGATWARGLLPDGVGKELDQPLMRLRSALTQLLGEHVALVIAAMRSPTGDRAEFTAFGVAVNGNTVDLTSAIESLFGAEAAEGFQARWADHVDELVAYARAGALNDSARQEQARLHLRDFEQSLAGFLSGATQNRLGQPALAQAFLLHDRMLLAEVDAYSSKDYQQAHDLSYQAYEEMFGVSGQLANAIGATVAGRLPSGGSQTGGGGMASVVGGR